MPDGQAIYTLTTGVPWVGGLNVSKAPADSRFRDIARDRTRYYMYLIGPGMFTPEVYRAGSVAGPWTSAALPGAAAALAGETYNTRSIMIGPDNTIYVFAFDGVLVGSYAYRSIDRALTFVRGTNPISPGPGPLSQVVRWIWMSYAGTLFSTSVVGVPPTVVRRSVDRGDNWTSPTMPANFNIPNMLGQEANGIAIFGITTGFGPLAGQLLVIRSNDDGQTWFGFAPTALGGMTTWSFLIVTQSGTLLAVSSVGGIGGVWRSADGGDTWVQTFTTGVIGQTITVLRQGNDAPQTIYAHYDLIAGGGHQIVSSGDDGLTWAPLPVANPFVGASDMFTFATDRQFHR